MATIEDDSGTILRMRSAGSSFGPYTAWTQVTIPPTEKLEEATIVTDDAGSYHWVFFVSGDQCAVFTAPYGHPEHGAGGRECYKGIDGNCGFFLPGHGTIYAASGRSCTGWGIPLCVGWCR